VFIFNVLGKGHLPNIPTIITPKQCNLNKPLRCIFHPRARRELRLYGSFPMARIMLSIQSVQFTTLLTFLLALTTIAHASLPFQQSPPPPGDLPNQPDPQATMPTPTSFVLFVPTSSSSAVSSQHNASRRQDGANQATPVPGSGPGPGHAVGHETIIGSLTTNPTTLGK
jgi:hypothetical protein